MYKPKLSSWMKRRQKGPLIGLAEHLVYAKLIGELPPPLEPPIAPRRRSTLCKQADFALDAYRYWSSAARLHPTLHRKHWEFFYISQTLYERGLLARGRRGLGFGVGREHLPALFASFGCDIVATDQDSERAAETGWQQSGQHASNLSALERPDICPPVIFKELVGFETVDMNHIPEHFDDQFDFCWSACCFEHLGSLEKGLAFVGNSIKTLKIGGVAVHTTEFNLSSNSETLEAANGSVYRRRDIESLIGFLEKAGHHVEPLDLDQGTTLTDAYVDLPPYRNEPHLRLRIAEYDCTSIGLIITRGG
jgi:SAM-dependent methyltransferase